MALLKDGWHKVYGEDVYVENGKVERGIKKDMNNSEVPCWPYEYDKKLGGWVNITGEVTLSTYRAGLKKGTKRMW